MQAKGGHVQPGLYSRLKNYKGGRLIEYMSYATEKKELGKSFLDRNVHIENDLDRDAKKAHELGISYGHMKALEYIKAHSIIKDRKPL